MCEILKKRKKGPSGTDWLSQAGDSEMCEWGQKIKTSIYKISHGGVMFSMVTLVSHTVL